MTSRYDIWRTQTPEEHFGTEGTSHEAFERSDEYLEAYVDYCEDFMSSAAYDRAFERWAGGDEEPAEPDYERYDRDVEDYDGMAYYGLHPEDDAEAI